MDGQFASELGGQFHRFMHSGTLNIDYETDGTLEIVDLLGRIQRTFILYNNKNKATFDVSNFATGVYVYRYNSKEIPTEKGKIVIIH